MKQLIFHINTIKENIKVLKSLFLDILQNYSLPLKSDDYFEIKENDFKIFDTIAYRYIKTQSILSEKLFREILEFGEYDTKNKSFIEILSELQKEGILESVEEWKILREIRNSLSHDYPYDEDDIIEAINFLYSKIEVLEKIINKIEEKYEKISAIKSKRN